MESFKQFCNEVKQDYLDDIDDNNDHLHDLLGGHVRVVVPIESPAELKFIGIFDKLGLRLDIRAGIVFVKTPTQKGVQERSERIGSFLGKLIKLSQGSGTGVLQDMARVYNANYWQELLSWWEKNKAYLNKQDQTKGVSVVISRSPIDIVRMSDHKEFSSCHSPPKNQNNRNNGAYFHCAMQEAKTGGPIAYVVRNEDLAKVPDINAPEIFKDRDRGIEGIEPLERLRLRRFVNGDDSLYIPDLKTYGTRHVGFQETVSIWANNQQRNIIDAKPDYKEWNRRGGSYMDYGSKSDDIWSAFLGVKVYGDKDSIDNEDSADNLEQRMEEVIAGHTYKHWHVDGNVEGGDDEPYIYGSASCCFQYDSELFDSIPSGGQLSCSSYSNGEVFGKQVVDDLELRNPGEEIYVDDNGGNVSICIDVRMEGIDIDSLESMLDEVDGYEKKYDDHYREIFKLLVSHEYISQEKLNRNWQHFAHDMDDGEISSEMIWVGDLEGIDPNKVMHNTIAKHVQGGQVYKKLEFINEPSLLSYVSSVFGIPEFKKENVQFYVSGQNVAYHKVYMQIVLYAYGQEEFKMLDEISKIDAHWEYFYRRAVNFWNQIKSKLLLAPPTQPYKAGPDHWNAEIQLPQPPPASKQKVFPSFYNYAQDQDKQDTKD